MNGHTLSLTRTSSGRTKPCNPYFCGQYQQGFLPPCPQQAVPFPLANSLLSIGACLLWISLEFQLDFLIMTNT